MHGYFDYQGPDGGGRVRPQHGEEEAREAAGAPHETAAGSGRCSEPHTRQGLISISLTHKSF